MIEELELVCQYKVTKDTTTGIYSFTTINDIEYDVIFNDAVGYYNGTSSYNDLSNVYSLILEKKTTGIEPYDRQLKLTIDSILQHFFQNTSNSLLYICQTNDGKHIKRNNTFDRWYQSSSFSDNLEKIDCELPESDGTINYTSLIYHQDNPFKASLENSHSQVIEVLKSEKDKTKVDSILNFLKGNK